MASSGKTPTAAGLPDLAAYLPWAVDIDALQSIANTNWNSPAGAGFYGGYNVSSGAQNAEINWDVVLGAGTWTISLTHIGGTNLGIYSVQIDGVEVGTVDGYRAAATSNIFSAVAGVVVAASGKKRVKLKMATKNAASTNYYGQIQHVQLRRTA